MSPRIAASARRRPTTPPLPAPMAFRRPISERRSRTLVVSALVTVRAEPRAARSVISAIKPDSRPRILPSESATRRITLASDPGTARSISYAMEETNGVQDHFSNSAGGRSFGFLPNRS